MVRRPHARGRQELFYDIVGISSIVVNVGKFVNFCQHGADLFQVMCEAERELGVSTFFMMDENFLLYRRRALELLACMKARNKAWALYVFSSANAIGQDTNAG